MCKTLVIILLFILNHNFLKAQNEENGKNTKIEFEFDSLQLLTRTKIENFLLWIEESGVTDEEVNSSLRPILISYGYSDYRELIANFDSLVASDWIIRDSIQTQKTRIDSLKQSIEAGRLAEYKLDSLRKENEFLKSIMKNYTLQLQLEQSGSVSSIDSADIYYYQLDSHKKPKIYVYNCPQDDKKSQYWKVSAKPKENTLLTEAFANDFTQIERFEEKYDSLGSKLIDYCRFEEGSKSLAEIEKNEVYLWQPSDEFSYSMKYDNPDGEGEIGLTKTRSLLRIDSLMVLGELKEVAVFYGEYSFVNTSTNQRFKFTQFSYYAKGIGFVKYERSIPINTTEYEFVSLELDSILTRKEWSKLVKRSAASNKVKR